MYTLKIFHTCGNITTKSVDSISYAINCKRSAVLEDGVINAVIIPNRFM